MKVIRIHMLSVLQLSARAPELLFAASETQSRTIRPGGELDRY